MKKEKGRKERKGRLIPEGELKCVWMEAGVVSYKLCDYEYECERCPFDQVLKKRAKASVSQNTLSGRHSGLQRISTEKEAAKNPPVVNETINFDKIFQEFYDIEFQEGLFYHPGHTWVDIENPNIVKIGLDGFAGKFLLGIKMAILPTVRNRTDRGQVCCWIVEEEGTLPIIAPLTGAVIAINHRLSREPTLINRNPYEQGWLMKIEPEDLHRDLQYLSREHEIPPHHKMELETLRTTLESHLRGNWKHVGPTLCDGGRMLDHIRDMIGPKRYFEIVSTFFKIK
ncbi:MAG: glycine cleavage system protein H [Gemmatimonadota bacterium]|nr:MAG: glycine cleavage system protein H [Gemmatimonadota bacterium]